MQFIICKTVTETFLERVHSSPDVAAFEYKTGGVWKQVTFGEFYNECRLLAFGLLTFDLKPQDKVALLSSTRYEWSLCDMSILGAAAVTIPIYSSSTASDVAYLLNHSEASVAFVEDTKQLQKIIDQAASLPQLKKVVLIEGTAKDATMPFEVISLQALRELGRNEEARDPTRVDRNLSGAKPDDLITICYTSGTTGVPKGVMISHANMMSVLEDAIAVLSNTIEGKELVLLSFLPFSHILGKVESMAIYAFGWRQAFAENLDKLVQNLQEVRPTVIFTVPRIFEKAYERVMGVVNRSSGLKKQAFDWAIDSGNKYFETIDGKRKPSLRQSAEYAVARALVFKRVMEKLGGRLIFAVCGGAPLSREIGEFFQVAGVKILEGYGLTETCGPVSFNTPEELRFGSVGRPLPEVAFKIADDGEILIKSKKVFPGYYKMPEETEASLSQGWFKTGDIGHIDEDGFLHITDRKKDIIVTSGGKNVAPQKIENLAKNHPWITEFMVYGDRRPYLTALVTLDPEKVIQFAAEKEVLFSGYGELIKNPKVLNWVQKIVDEVNKQLANYETIKKFIILPNSFSIEGGELTPSLKMRRNAISQRYSAELDQLYLEPRGRTEAGGSLDLNKEIG